MAMNGVSDFFCRDLSTLKARMLIFERLYFDFQLFEDYLEATSLKFFDNWRPESVREAMTTVEHLGNEGILVDYNFRGMAFGRPLDTSSESDDDSAPLIKEYSSKLDSINERLAKYNSLVTGENPGFSNSIDIDYALAVNGTIASELEGLASFQAQIAPFFIPEPDILVPVLSNSPTREGATKKDSVVDLVFRQFPIPHESVGFEQLLDFQRNPETRQKYLTLRDWITEISRSPYSSTEIEEKIEFLLNEYEQFMQRAKIKFRKGTLEILLTTSAEVLENLLTLKWSRIAKSLFSLGKEKVAFLEAERTAPGRELAYVYETRKTFANSVES